MTFHINRICLNFSLMLSFLLLLQAGYGQSKKKTAPSPFPEIDELIEQKKNAFGGKIAVMVWKDNKVLYEKEAGEEFKTSTKVPVTYASKWFTTAVVLNVIDQGKLSLDDKVSEYLPIFAKYAKGYITIRDCLANTTGLEGDADKVQRYFQRKKFASLEEEVNFYASKKEIESNPGTEYFYGNIGLNIAARVVEVVSKKSFDRIALEKVFRPLQMKNTSFTNDENTINPSTGATSTAADYLKFLAMIMNNGTLNGKTILTEESVKTLHSIVNPALPVKYVPKGIEGLTPGLGVWIEQEGNADSVAAVYCPGFYGSWAFIDYRKKYACVIVVPPQKKEDNRMNYLAIKEALDEEIN